MVQNRLIIVAFLLLLGACSKYKTEIDNSLYGNNFRGHSRQWWDSVDKPFWSKLDSIAQAKGEDELPSERATVGFTSGNLTKVVIKHPSVMVKQVYYVTEGSTAKKVDK